MTSVILTTQRLMHMFDGKIQEFINDIDNVPMVWLAEIQQEANRMFSSDFNVEPELMPKTPSQRKNTRRRRVSSGQLEESRVKRRFSKGRRSNLRGSGVKTLDSVVEAEGTSEAAAPGFSGAADAELGLLQPNRPELTAEVDNGKPSHDGCDGIKTVHEEEPEVAEDDATHGQIQDKPEEDGNSEPRSLCTPPPETGSDTTVEGQSTMPDAVVVISEEDRRSAEIAKEQKSPQGRTATKMAIAGARKSSRRSSVRHSLTLKRSLAGLRHSMTLESVRRTSRRSFLKKKAMQGSSMCSSDAGEAACTESDGEGAVEHKEVMLSEEPGEVQDKAPNQVSLKKAVNADVRITRSKMLNTPNSATPPSIVKKDLHGSGAKAPDRSSKVSTPRASIRSSRSVKRKAVDVGEGSPRKRLSPPKKSQSAIKPNMRSFLHTVQKNQILMMSPSTLGRTAVVKSFIKHTTPLKVTSTQIGGIVERERLKLEALKKKQEQEAERKKKMEEEKRRKQEEMKRKREEKLRKVVEARVKEEQQREEDMKKKLEQKMAQMDEKTDKLRVERLAEEKAKKRVAIKRQEELEQRRKQEEEARLKKIQQAEEEAIRHQKILAKKRAEEEEQRARRLAEARRAQEEREKELEKERLAAAERQRIEKEKAVALQRELEKAAREKERRELEEKQKEIERQKMEEQRRLEAEKAAAATKQAMDAEVKNNLMKTPLSKTAGLNVTIDLVKSPQSYDLTPKGGNKPTEANKDPENYGMDQNSDDSTDDESDPRKPIPSWAQGINFKRAVMEQYYHPPSLDSCFGAIMPLKLENIFKKSKPRYYKRTSSAVWNSPPKKSFS